jgi:anti-sigma factor RsiW
MCQKHPQFALDDFVDGLLDVENQAAVAVHLEECPSCAAYVGSLRETRKLLQQAGTLKASRKFERGLDTRIYQYDLQREGVKLLALGLAAIVLLLRLLPIQRGSGKTSVASTPRDSNG